MVAEGIGPLGVRRGGCEFEAARYFEGNRGTAYTGSMIEAIVFDFDGVIVDSEPLHYQAFAKVAKSLGFDFDYDRYLRDFVGFDDRDAFGAMLKATSGEVPADRDEQIQRLCAHKQSILETIVKSSGVSPLPGARELAAEAKQAGVPVAIASGATRFDITLMLDGLGCGKLFELIVSADDVRQSKPDPQTYTMATHRLGVEPGLCLAIEDTAAGIRSAKGAGLLTLGVATTGSEALLYEAQRVATSLNGITLNRLREWYD